VPSIKFKIPRKILFFNDYLAKTGGIEEGEAPKGPGDKVNKLKIKNQPMTASLTGSPANGNFCNSGPANNNFRNRSVSH